MDKALKKQAKEWFEKGDHDFETAQLLLAEKGYIDVISYHIQQAIEKYVKGYLVLNGHTPPRIHDLDSLLNLVAKFDKNFYDEFIELCEKATKYYFEDRYPPGTPTRQNYADMEEDLKKANELIQAIKNKL